MTDQPIKIDSSAKLPPRQRKLRGLYGLAVAAVLVYLATLFGAIPAFRPAAKKEVVLPETAVPTPPRTAEVRLDESQLQWISPTSGEPITLEYVPLGTQVLLHVRPAELIGHAEGEKILAALGPWGERAVDQIEEFTSTRLSEIESLLIALLRVDDRWDYSLRATYKEPRSTAPTEIAGRTAFLPQAGQGRVLVSCPTEIATELKEHGDMPALLARDLERLLPLTDQDRSATLLMPVKFLDTEGRELFVGGGEKLITAFDVLVPDNASAVLLSCDWRDNFFCELAATIVQNAPAHRFNTEFAKHLNAAGEQLAESLAAHPPHAYGKTVAERFPAMLRTMSDYTRVSQEKGIALARCYLPIQAGHNLLLASQLRTHDTGAIVETTTTETSLADRLGRVTTLSFPRETLENALEILATDAQFPIQIAGRDLQLEGITKNQTFALDLRNRPVAEILVEVLRRANPDHAATSPSDPRQKLVYVIRDGVVTVTTRSAAAQRNEELPEVFRDTTR